MNRQIPFKDRYDGGEQLAHHLEAYRDNEQVIVLGLARGGVPVAYAVARALNVELDVFLVRKLGVPMNEEAAMGAIATGGTRVLNRKSIQSWGISEDTIEAVTGKEQRELQRRERAYRGDRPLPDLKGHIVILVDDGLATGASMQAAVMAIKQQQSDQIIVAVPTAPPQVCDALRSEVDEVICAVTPQPFRAVGLWYEDFSQTTDDEVQRLLANYTPTR